MIRVFCTEVPGRQWPSLSLSALYSQVLNRVVGTNIRSNTHHFFNECFCCTLALFVTTDTTGQGSNKLLLRRADGKYLSPLGVLRSVLQAFDSATVQWNELQKILQQEEHGCVPANLNLQKQEAGWIWPTITVPQPWPNELQSSLPCMTWKQTNASLRLYIFFSFNHQCTTSEVSGSEKYRKSIICKEPCGEVWRTIFTRNKSAL